MIERTYEEVPGSSVLRGAYERFCFSMPALANSITAPWELEEDTAEGALTLFNASLYFLNRNVLFLVAIEEKNSPNTNQKNNQ